MANQALLDMADLFEVAAGTGAFVFDKVDADTCFRFLHKHAPKDLVINVGSRDTATVAALKLLAAKARDMAGDSSK